MGYVYAIHNTANGKYYIGQTYRLPALRFNAHIHDAKHHTNMAICRAILKHGAHFFELQVLGEYESQETLNDAEQLWIAVANATNPKVGYNISAGGRGYGRRSNEQRAAMSALFKGRPATEAQMKGLRAGWEHAWRPSGPQTPEHVAKRAAKLRGRKFGPEFGAAVSAGKKGKTMHPKALANLKLGPGSSRGFKFTDEQRERLRLAHVGQGKGRVLSEETRQKISASHRARFAQMGSTQ